jgi:TfoX/Sxy family transcriptional regulator of competence genes
MAYDEELARRVRNLLDSRADVNERMMFGGICFLVGGKIACGVRSDELIVRAEPEHAYELIESEPGARPFDHNGRPIRGWLWVAREATAEDADLERWVRRGEAFAASQSPR